MSAWSQAVWIVKKLENKINFQIDVDTYTDKLNDLNDDVNDLNNRIDNIQINSITIIAEENNEGEPEIEQQYGKWTTWLIAKEE